MANTEVVQIIIDTTASSLLYLLPVIAVLSGINFIVTWLMSITFGLARRSFRG